MTRNNNEENIIKDSTELNEEVEEKIEVEDDDNKENSDLQDEKVIVLDEKELLQKQLDALKEENETLKEENKLSSNKLNAVEEKYTNLVSEYENYRNRTAKEKEEIFNTSCEKILKEFLPVLDNLERAIEADGSVDELKQGIEMTIKGFITALEKLEIEEICTDGEFNPNLHNAVMHLEDDAYGKNEIVQVFQKGYKRGDKVLRYSMVQVAN
ncbi:nucleotide exchange factor GrpE [Hathewaya limosa]|uniref:Protein GrpE n=1 Tax=Hathewaya limosa TaxID=1536 RepID=A0ABU0JPA9_HATLI|nr:nucleotide exchange factor GrpE [Hathewaya limosa]MDQ0478903.1 molecular chaperone GrpE [Hathewaya limosa]